MSSDLNNIKSRINQQVNIHLNKKERDPNYQKFKKCLNLRFKDCVDSDNGFESTYQNQMCRNEAITMCMTKFPYDTSLDLVDENSVSPVTNRLSTYEQIKKNPLTKKQIVNKISTKVANKVAVDKLTNNQLDVNQLIDKEIAKQFTNETFKLEEDEENLIDKLGNSIVFLWSYVIEPNFTKIFTLIILVLLLVQAKNHGWL